MAFVRLELDQAIEKQGGGKIAIVIVAEVAEEKCANFKQENKNYQQ